MTENKPYVAPLPEADGNYAYYCVGSLIPVRVKLNGRGWKIAADVPDHKNGGVLKSDLHMMLVVIKDDDVTSITKEEFVELVRNYMSNRAKNFPPQ